ncbi:ROK family protein [Anaerocolumna xylanovorans]|uniref:Glucokinase n=1 Tax=Anaerocolumna xylanovorans DSM 12503 TaxID=1121345 RepID=A0A1M7XWC6_9FIRM|nr:ROK family protein [Anaerocolumna xylanovorans]SHO43037.1 glucokinase [Anaerocolumna xylanovorans DSM 12503]
MINQEEQISNQRLDIQKEVTMEYIGMDIGGTSLKLGIINEEGTVLSSAAFEVAFDGYETPILNTAVKSLKHFLEEHRRLPGEFAGIGVSATGQVDPSNGVIAGTAGHIKNWQGSRIRDTLFENFKLPVTVMNDANCAALAEKWIGGAKEVSDALVITIGTGVGGGILINSKIFTGLGFAGELGHFSLKGDGKPCTCGNRGCYEQYASTTALVNAVAESVSKGLLSLEDFENRSINGRSIFKLLSCGNPVLLPIYGQWLDDIAQGLVSLTHIFNPQLILLGGGVSKQEKLFIEPLQKKVMERVMPAFRQGLQIKAASLFNDAGIVGAVYYFKNFRDK